MPLPANARVQAARSFVQNLRAAHEFMRQQDDAGAAARHAALLKKLQEAREHLRWNPSAGRPARFLSSRSVQVRALAARVEALADAQGVPQLRELVIKPYVLLYAHSAERVVLLALKHERQLSFDIGR